MKILIDANNYLKRVYHGGGDPYILWANLLRNNMDKEVVVVCDTGTSRKYRKEIFADYKKGRKQGDDPIYWELYNNCKTIARHYQNAIVVEVTHGEADDYIMLNALGGDTVISNDKDLWPLVAEGVNILISATTKVDRDLIKVKFAHPDPELILAYKSLVGDSSDNIKGKVRFGIKAYEKLSLLELRQFAYALDNNNEHELIDENVKTSYRLAKPFSGYSYSLCEPLDYKELQSFYTEKGIIC